MIKDLKVSLTSWDNISAPHIKHSAICATIFEDDKKEEKEGKKEVINSIITFGCFTGEIIRWVKTSDKKRYIPLNASFAHTTKVIAIKNCSQLTYSKLTASLSVDGTLCIWSTIDGICLAKYPNIFPYGCRIMEAYNEYIAVSGSFPLVYVFNINEGKIIKAIHPTNRYTIALGFINNIDIYLLDIDCKGTGTYINLNDESKYCKAQFLDPKEMILQARISPNFNYLLSLYKNSFVVTNLLVQGYPSVTISFPNAMDCIWVNNYKFTVMQYADLAISYIIEEDCLDLETSLNIHMKLTNTNIGKQIFLLNNEEKIPLLMKTIPCQIKETVNIGGADIVFNCLTNIFDTTIIGYMDCFCLLPSILIIDMEEYILPSFFSQDNDAVTSQCLEIKKKTYKRPNDPEAKTISHDVIASIINGTGKGDVIINNVADKSTKLLEGIHEGSIVQICTLKNNLYIAYSDFSLIVYDLDKQIEVKKFQHFMSPIIMFCVPERPTNSVSDKFLFCLTKKGNISVIDIDALDSVFAFTGHDGAVQGIYIHPATDMLIVNAKSLYFWSMRTGNLESIVNGNMKHTYLKEFENTLIKVLHFNETTVGIGLKQLDFGGRSLRVLDVDIKGTASKIRSFLEDGKDQELKDIIPNIPNFPLVIETFAPETVNYINKECGTKYKQTMQLSFVGDKSVHTVYLYKDFKELIKLFSENVSAILLVIKVIYALSLGVHPKFREIMESIFERVSEIVATKVPPNIVTLFRCITGAGFKSYQNFLHVIKTFPESLRISWFRDLKLNNNKTILMRDMLAIAYSGVGATIFNDLNESDKQDVVTKISKFLGTKEFTEFASLLYDANIKEFQKFTSAIKEGIKQIAKIQTDSNDDKTNLDFYIEKIPLLFLSATAEQCKDGSNKNISETLIEQLTKFVSNGKSRTTYTHQFIATIIESYKSLSKEFITQQFSIIDVANSWFCYRQQGNLVAYGSGITGTLFLTKFMDKELVSAIVSITKEPIEKLDIDSNGKFIYVFCIDKGNMGTLHIFSYTIETNGDDHKLVTEDFLKMKISRDTKLSWTGSKLNMSIGSTKKEVINTKAKFNEYIEKRQAETFQSQH